MPLIPAPGSIFENYPHTSTKEINQLRKACEIDLQQMYHCKQCRADAIGLLGDDRSGEFNTSGEKKLLVLPDKEDFKSLASFDVIDKKVEAL
jgi:nitrogen fixation protein NifB